MALHDCIILAQENPVEIIVPRKAAPTMACLVRSDQRSAGAHTDGLALTRLAGETGTMAET